MATPTSSRRFSRFQPQEDHETVVPTVSASVGHDHWANDVLNKVTNSTNSGSSGSNSPESSYCDGASDPGSAGVGRLLDSAEAIKAKVLEKKRKFHTGRCLELKNLPDGCVEQVRLRVTFLTVDHKWRETTTTDPSSLVLISMMFSLTRRANRLASFSRYAISGANGQRFRQSFVSISSKKVTTLSYYFN